MNEMPSNMTIFVNGTKLAGTIVVGQGYNTFQFVVAALKIASVKKFEVRLIEGEIEVAKEIYPEGRWIRPGSKVATVHGVTTVSSIEDTTDSHDRKEGKVVEKFNLDSKRTAIVLLDNDHFTYTQDGIEVLDY